MDQAIRNMSAVWGWEVGERRRLDVPCSRKTAAGQQRDTDIQENQEPPPRGVQDAGTLKQR